MNRAELHLHTSFSEDPSTLTVHEAIDIAAKRGLCAIAITCLNNVQDLQQIRAAQEQHPTVRVLCGAEIQCGEDRMTLLAQSRAGLKNMYRILSAMKDGKVDRAVVEQHRADLLIGSCGDQGALYKAIAAGEDGSTLAAFYDYFELFPTEHPEAQEIYRKIYALAEVLGRPAIAVSNAHTLDAADADAREFLSWCVGQEYRPAPHFYTDEEMEAAFAYLGEEEMLKAVYEAPVALCATVQEFNLMPEAIYEFELPHAAEQLRERVFRRATELYGHPLPGWVRERLEQELFVLLQPSIFCLNAEMTDYIHKKGYYTESRGVVGDSFVAYLMGISEINPLPPHYRCPACGYAELEGSVLDGFDLPLCNCPQCGKEMAGEGHALPWELFYGPQGSILPRIHIRYPFSRQEEMTGYLRHLCGEARVANSGISAVFQPYRIKTLLSDYQEETGRTLEEEAVVPKIMNCKCSNGIKPGGYQVLPQGLEWEDLTPVIEGSTHLEDHCLALHTVGVNVWGSDAPDLLKRLEERTGVSVEGMDWSDPALYHLLQSDKLAGLPCLDHPFFREAMQVLRLQKFSDLVRMFCFGHGMDLWKNNAEFLLASRRIRAEQLCTTQEDLFTVLSDYGIPAKEACQIVRWARFGKLKRHPEAIEQLQKAGMPQWYLDFLCKCTYFFSRVPAISDAITLLRLAWFKEHYPEDFYTVCLLSDPKDPAELYKEIADRGLEISL